MNYNFSDIEFVEAIILSGYKTGVQVQVTIKIKKGVNQIDKRWIDKYVEMWHIPKNVEVLLKKHTGEILPTIKNPKDKRRMYINEFSEEE